MRDDFGCGGILAVIILHIIILSNINPTAAPRAGSEGRLPVAAPVAVALIPCASISFLII
jgi:hypothetical protein